MWPTIIVSSVIALLVVAIIVKAIINKKKGKSSYSCGCGGCPMKESCHDYKK